MRKRTRDAVARGLAVLAAVASLALGAAACSSRFPRATTFAAAVRQRPDVTIVVTDSGLGGLSVVAELAARLPASGITRSVRIVFVNALLDDAIGYNDLKVEADKIRVFDAALEAMEVRYSPDLILVACNTLSVFYDKTLHARTGHTETVGIVGLGADLIARELASRPDARAVIFATKTTIESGAHRQLLLEKGIAPDRVVGEPCHRLAGAIERGAASEETKGYVDRFVGEAVGLLPPGPAPIVASLNCTHYGYALPLWKEAFARLGRTDVTLLDPNPLMAELTLKRGGEKHYPSTKVTVEVVSKVPIGPEVQASLGTLLRTVSPATAGALKAYRYDPGLFSVKVDPSAVIR